MSIIENFAKIGMSKFSKKNSENQRFSDTFNSFGIEVFDAISFRNVNYSKFSIAKERISIIASSIIIII